MLRFYIVFDFVVCLEKSRIGTWIKQMNEGMKQISKGYETAQTKGTFKNKATNKTNLYS